MTLSSRKNQLAKVIVLALILLTIAFIWSNSLDSKPESQAKSLDLIDLLRPILEPFVGPGNTTDHLIRKLAHFTEFGLLGCALALLLIVCRKIKFQSVINCLFASLAVAVIDESIQIFTGRGPMVSDILLDFSGAVAGIVFVLVIYWIKVAADKKR